MQSSQLMSPKTVHTQSHLNQYRDYHIIHCVQITKEPLSNPRDLVSDVTDSATSPPKKIRNILENKQLGKSIVNL